MTITRTDRNQVFQDGRLLEEQVVEVDVTTDTNRATIEEQIHLALSALAAIIDTPQATFSTVAQAQAQIRTLQGQVKDEARILRRLIRLQVGDLTGTD